jgi:EAL domain-containing protein (putative c-di-GMP-specific phosphodiesterase class I)
LGTVHPGEFIPLAEETGLIIEIGEWVLRNACRQMMEWKRQGTGLPRVAVNISPVQFAQPQFAALVSTVLEQTGLDPAALELEVTESLLMSAPESAVQSLAALKTIGVQLAIDDFGTGYSSLSRLKEFPIDRLKIDQSFVRDLPNRKNDAAIATAVIAMADSMGLQVTAEGVETKEQAQFLADKGCDELQGFYLGEPAPAAEIGRALSNCPSA